MLVLALVVKASIAVLLCAIGMSATLNDITYLWRRPALLLRSLFAMYVVVPFGAVTLARVFDPPWRTKVVLVVLAICAGAPLLPRKLVKLGGDASYGFSLVVATSVLAVVTVPVGLQVVSRFVPFESTVGPSEIAATILKAILLPLAAGMLVRALRPKTADWLGDRALQVAGTVLGVCAILSLVVGFRLVLDLGLPSLLTLAAFTIMALATGHFLGGPDPAQCSTLALACATRHVGLALLVAATYRAPDTLTLVAGYLLTSVLVSIPYVRWRREVLAS